MAYNHEWTLLQLAEQYPNSHYSAEYQQLLEDIDAWEAQRFYEVYEDTPDAVIEKISTLPYHQLTAAVLLGDKRLARILTPHQYVAQVLDVPMNIHIDSIIQGVTSDATHVTYETFITAHKTLDTHFVNPDIDTVTIREFYMRRFGNDAFITRLEEKLQEVIRERNWPAQTFNPDGAYREFRREWNLHHFIDPDFYRLSVVEYLSKHFIGQPLSDYLAYLQTKLNALAADMPTFYQFSQICVALTVYLGGASGGGIGPGEAFLDIRSSEIEPGDETAAGGGVGPGGP